MDDAPDNVTTLTPFVKGDPRTKELSRKGVETRQRNRKAREDAAARRREGLTADALRELGRARSLELIEDIRNVDFGLLAKALAADLMYGLMSGDYAENPKDVASIAAAVKTFHGIARLEDGKPTELIDDETDEGRQRRLAELRRKAADRRGAIEVGENP